MQRLLICLVMIVKNEAHCIQKTLESVKGAVDCWVILDTGSTDGTQKIVRDVLWEVPGRLCEAPFVDFSTSRNEVLQLVRDTVIGHASEGFGFDLLPVFTLMLSADETLSGGSDLRAFLEEHRHAVDGAYSVTMMSECTRWSYPRILRVDTGWRYTGEVHEVPVGPGGETDGPVIPGVTITHAATDPERRRARMQDFDLPALTRVVEDEFRALRDHAQAAWFLAQTYDGLADGIERTVGGVWITYKLAAMSFYWRRVEIGGAMGESDDTLKTRYAIFRYLNVAEKVGFYTDEELLSRLHAIAADDPPIPEVNYMMAVHAAKVDVCQGLFFAEQAASVAREMLAVAAYHLPMDTRLEWLSLRVGAACAEQLGRLSYARELAERAVLVGGPRTLFEEYLSLQDGTGDVDETTSTVDRTVN